MKHRDIVARALDEAIDQMERDWAEDAPPLKGAARQYYLVNGAVPKAGQMLVETFPRADKHYMVNVKPHCPVVFASPEDAATAVVEKTVSLRIGDDVPKALAAGRGLNASLVLYGATLAEAKQNLDALRARYDGVDVIPRAEGNQKNRQKR